MNRATFKRRLSDRRRARAPRPSRGPERGPAIAIIQHRKTKTVYLHLWHWGHQRWCPPALVSARARSARARSARTAVARTAVARTPVARTAVARTPVARTAVAPVVVTIAPVPVIAPPRIPEVTRAPLREGPRLGSRVSCGAQTGQPQNSGQRESRCS